MDEASWKGHNFTLLIFGGVVVLCSIFFILGMIVGRSQTTETREIASVPEDIGSEQPEPEELDLRFYEAVEQSRPSPLEGSTPSFVPTPAPAAVREEASVPAPILAITLQIAALSNAEQAEALRQEISGQGLPAFVSRPAPGDQPPLHRVQVGPFDDEDEVARVRAVLESEGYEPIVRN